MELLLTVAIIGFVAWWIRYNQLYSSGAVKTPFFSFGSSGQSRVRRVKATYRPVARATAPTSPGHQREVGQAVSKITTYTHNSEVSVRLLVATRQSNPGKSVDWCAEKVVSDILRDRR